MKMIQRGLFRACFQPITMLNCCTTCISWEIGSYNTQESRHTEHTHFCRNFVAKSATWFSENEGGVKGRLELFRKFISFGDVILPLSCSYSALITSTKIFSSFIPSLFCSGYINDNIFIQYPPLVLLWLLQRQWGSCSGWLFPHPPELKKTSQEAHTESHHYLLKRTQTIVKKNTFSSFQTTSTVSDGGASIWANLNEKIDGLEVDAFKRKT